MTDLDKKAAIQLLLQEGINNINVASTKDDVDAAYASYSAKIAEALTKVEDVELKKEDRDAMNEEFDKMVSIIKSKEVKEEK